MTVVHLKLEELHHHCREHGMHVEVSVDDRSIMGRSRRNVVRVQVVRDDEAVRRGRPRVAGGRACTLATLDRACDELLAAL